MIQIQIADSFQKSSASLTNNEKGRLLDLFSHLQQDPDSSGLNLERVQSQRDANLWSVRATQDIRVILWRNGNLTLLLYAAHHDEAYQWAARHRIGTDPRSGAIQLILLPTVQEQTQPPPPLFIPSATAPAAPDATIPLSPPDAWPVPPSVSGGGAPPPPAPFTYLDDASLLGYGAPVEWLAQIRSARSADDFADRVAPDLPPDVADRLIALSLGLPLTTAEGEAPAEFIESIELAVEPPPLAATIRAAAEDQRLRVSPVGQQFHPVSDLEELNRLLTHPLARWLAFLHPDQRRLVDRRFSGPVKVTGSAGTGKTVLAIHRARALARRGKRILLTSYTNALCDNLSRQMDMLCSQEERQRIRILTVHAVATQLARAAGDRATTLRDHEAARDLRAAAHPGLPISAAALVGEWQAIIAPQGIVTWDAYRAARRAGRGRPLSVAQRKLVWDAIAPVLQRWQQQRRVDFSTLCDRAHGAVIRDPAVVAGAFPGGVGAVIVDEVQDLGPAELRLLATLAGDGADRLFLTGDGGQRIYGRRLSLASCGIPVRGRSFILRVNYRTTAQIRRFADRVLSPLADDLDEGQERRRAVRSVLSGAYPAAQACATPEAEAEAIAQEIQSCAASGYALEDIAVFTRTNARAEELRQALQRRNILAHDLDPSGRSPSQDTAGGSAPSAVTVTTLHRAKGMEYKAVIVSGASRDTLPLPGVVHEGLDPADQEDAMAREVQLLYVGLTRARDRLLVTWTGAPSEYLEEALTAPEGASLSAR